MTAVMMSGEPVATAVLADVGERVAKLAADGRTVGLGTLLVGDDPASAGYVRKKHEACPSKWKDEGDKTLAPSAKMVGRVHEALEEQEPVGAKK